MIELISTLIVSLGAILLVLGCFLDSILIPIAIIIFFVGDFLFIYFVEGKKNV